VWSGYGPAVSSGVTAHAAVPVVPPPVVPPDVELPFEAVVVEALVGDDPQPAAKASPAAPRMPRASRRFTFFFVRVLFMPQYTAKVSQMCGAADKRP
jgi:hypothetical protein